MHILWPLVAYDDSVILTDVVNDVRRSVNRPWALILVHYLSTNKTCSSLPITISMNSHFASMFPWILANYKEIVHIHFRHSQTPMETVVDAGNRQQWLVWFLNFELEIVFQCNSMRDFLQIFLCFKQLIDLQILIIWNHTQRIRWGSTRSSPVLSPNLFL